MAGAVRPAPGLKPPHAAKRRGSGELPKDEQKSFVVFACGVSSRRFKSGYLDQLNTCQFGNHAPGRRAEEFARPARDSLTVGRRIYTMTPAVAIELENARERIVLAQLERRGINDPRVLAAMRTGACHRRRAARPAKQESWLN